MNLSDSKKKLAFAGILCGIVAAVLAVLGNPGNMAFCIACFIRDTAGAMKMHSAAVVQCNKRISFIRWFFTDDTFCTWYDHYDRFVSIFRLSAPYGNPYVSRRFECMGCSDRICRRCCDRSILLEERL